MHELSAQQCAQFDEDGFLILRELAPHALFAEVKKQADILAENPTEPVEFEAAVGYPGAPDSLEAPGGRTVRRIRRLIGRHPIFLDWASHPVVTTKLRQLLGNELVIPLAHHNCIMFKDPRYSSDTGWHQDTRYWRFERTDLINVLLALDSSDDDKGSLRFIPGTHRMTFEPAQLDEESFLRTDHPANEPLLARVVTTAVKPGDAIFFHGRTFHAANRNRSDCRRRSMIYTYTTIDNKPLPGSRSAELPQILLRDS